MLISTPLQISVRAADIADKSEADSNGIRVVLDGNSWNDGFSLKVFVENTKDYVVVDWKILIDSKLFDIDTVKEYPADYTECTEVAKTELREKARPELKQYLDSIAEYDIIFLGYPIWWGIPPMAVSTFLEHYDFSGKKILPFATHEGSGLGGSINYLKKICPNATIVQGLAVYGSEVRNSEATVVNWANNNI